MCLKSSGLHFGKNVRVRVRSWDAFVVMVYLLKIEADIFGIGRYFVMVFLFKSYKMETLICFG